MAAEELRFPWELIDHVISYILISDTPTILSLCLVSRAMYEEAAKLLYHTISSAEDSRPKKYPLTRLLAHNPNISRLVNTYTTSDIYRTTFQPELSLWGLTAKALTLMVNLQHLCFRSNSMVSNTETMFSDVPFQLETLDWNGDTPGLMALLKTQKNLKAIHLSSLVPVHGLPNHRVPGCSSVISIAGNLRNVVDFLDPKVRPPNLHHVRYIPSAMDLDFLNDNGSYRRMKAAFRSVTHLMLSGSVFTDLRRFGDIFSAITCLEVYVLMFGEGGLAYLSWLKNLKTLFLSTHGSPSYTEDRARTMAAFLLGRSVSLQHVLIARAGLPLNETYLYWNGASGGFALVEYGPERRRELLCPSSHPQVDDPFY